MRTRIIPFLLALLLCGCGFHLRGLMHVPNGMNAITISSNSGDLAFESLLKSQLASYKIRTPSNPKLAAYWLIINRLGFEQRMVSVGASTNPRQYQLILTLEFSLQSAKAKVVIPQKRVTISRLLTINNDRILGSNAEEHTLQNEMREEAIMQMLKIIFTTTTNTHAN